MQVGRNVRQRTRIRPESDRKRLIEGQIGVKKGGLAHGMVFAIQMWRI